MNNIYKYLYTFAAFAFSGIGYGLIYFIPFFSDYEMKTHHATYELEQVIGVEFSEEIDCSNYQEIHLDCRYTQYLNASLIDKKELIIEMFFRWLLMFGLLSFFFGLFSHVLILMKECKINKKNDCQTHTN